jgi:hypothetical protein
MFDKFQVTFIFRFTRSFLLKAIFLVVIPGDGGCLFHSLATWISYIQSGIHNPFDSSLADLSNQLRSLAVEMLRKPQTFCIENNEFITNEELLELTAQYANTTVSGYLKKMLNPTEWGGGPEIVALCNHFQCPIHIYQLTLKDNADKNQKLFSSKEFCLETSARFGSPIFDDHLPICLLHADGRFPNITPEEFDSNKKEHFLALFPSEKSLQRFQDLSEKKSFRNNKFGFFRSFLFHSGSTKKTYCRLEKCPYFRRGPCGHREEDSINN